MTSQSILTMTGDAELQRHIFGSVISDFASGFFQASDLNVDAQRRTMEKMGVDVIWGKTI